MLIIYPPRSVTQHFPMCKDNMFFLQCSKSGSRTAYDFAIKLPLTTSTYFGDRICGCYFHAQKDLPSNISQEIAMKIFFINS